MNLGYKDRFKASSEEIRSDWFVEVNPNKQVPDNISLIRSRSGDGNSLFR